jgi:hypothetical protein
MEEKSNEDAEEEQPIPMLGKAVTGSEMVHLYRTSFPIDDASMQ